MEYLEKLMQFLNEVKGEMKKVSWPNRQEIISSTIVIIITVTIVVIYVGLVDLGIVSLLGLVLDMR